MFCKLSGGLLGITQLSSDVCVMYVMQTLSSLFPFEECELAWGAAQYVYSTMEQCS